MTTANDIISLMLDMQNEQQRQILSRFFKTGKGEYGEGDKFIGMKVPQTRTIVKEARFDVPFEEVEKLLYSEWHEVRLCGFLLLVEEMKAALPKRKAFFPKQIKNKRSANENYKDFSYDEEFLHLANRRGEIASLYLHHAKRANNWDLVDLSSGYIIGEWLLYPSSDGSMPSRGILDSLADSKNLWEQRIAIVSTSMLIRNQQYDDTIRIATKLLYHPHDLIQKAVGWMLREVGKRDIEVLRSFLSQYRQTMPRTALRYAIEKMDAVERKYWMRH